MAVVWRQQEELLPSLLLLLLSFFPPFPSAAVLLIGLIMVEAQEGPVSSTVSPTLQS